MSTIVSTTPFTESEALETKGGSLPTGVDPEKYEELLVTIKEDGLQELRPQELNTVKRVIEFQKSVRTAAQASEATQDKAEAIQPGIGRV